MSASRDGRGGRHGELTFTGPATFFKAPHVPAAELGGEADRADAALLGVPYDVAVGFRPGARFAPAALRAASGRYVPPPEGFFDPAREERRLAGARLVDAGDVDPAQLETEESFARITRAARLVRAGARLPLFVGGDHSISLPLLRAYDDVEDLHVVQVDAHLDYSDARNGTRWANSCPFRRAAEELPGLGRITVLGLRGLRTDEEAWRAAEARGHELVTMRDWRRDPGVALDRLPEGRDVYLSFDIDALDPSIAPGTSSPEVEGLRYAEAIAIVEATVRRNRLVGMDLTELAPDLDGSGLTALVGARLLAETLALWWEHGGAAR